MPAVWKIRRGSTSDMPACRSDTMDGKESLYLAFKARTWDKCPYCGQRPQFGTYDSNYDSAYGYGLALTCGCKSGTTPKTWYCAGFKSVDEALHQWHLRCYEIRATEKGFCEVNE